MTQNNTNSAFTLPCYYSDQKFTLAISAGTQVKFVVEKKTVSRKPVESISDLDAASARLIHLRDGDVVLYRVVRSRSWQARFKTFEGKWVRFSTRQRNVELAQRYACDAYDEARYRQRLGFATTVKRFDEMAKYCCEDMRRDLAAGVGKKVYTAYIAVIETYFIPFFGQHYLTSITHKHIAEFELWRNTQLKRKPKSSTLLTFASALVILPFCKGRRSRNVTQPWPVAA